MATRKAATIVVETAPAVDYSGFVAALNGAIAAAEGLTELAARVTALEERVKQIAAWTSHKF